MRCRLNNDCWIDTGRLVYFKFFKQKRTLVYPAYMPSPSCSKFEAVEKPSLPDLLLKVCHTLRVDLCRTWFGI